jgi:hypothetical protein
MNPALTSAQQFDEKCFYCENAPLERDEVRLICNGNGIASAMRRSRSFASAFFPSTVANGGLRLSHNGRGK